MRKFEVILLAVALKRLSFNLVERLAMPLDKSGEFPYTRRVHDGIFTTSRRQQPEPTTHPGEMEK
jgi:hypothetical protein